MYDTPAGLDMATLRGIRGRRLDHSRLLARIDEHLEAHDGYVALSGGKDSVVVTHLARQVDPNIPVVWFDSGTEFPETRAYIHQLTQQWGLNLTVTRTTPTLLEALGASGQWDHAAPEGPGINVHEALILQPSRVAHDLHGPGELWGVRSAESHGRRTLHRAQLRRQIDTVCGGCCSTPGQQRDRHGGVVARVDGTTAYSPIWNWPTAHVWDYLAAHAIPTNPVYDKLRTMGAPEQALRVSHLIDAGHLNLGRVTWLRRGWPELYDQLVTALPRISEFV